MAIDDALVKLENTYDIKKITESEEDYIAWQAGMRLGQAGVGDVTSLNLSDGDLVGTYVNTSFDDAVDTRAGSISTMSVNLYQGDGSATESMMTKPVLKRSADDSQAIATADDTEMNVIVDRLIKTVFANDYPGTYKLASSPPSADYIVTVGAFVDTRADGTSVNYSIYRRTDGTSPTKVSPLRLSNAKDGFRAMSTSEIQYSFGQRMKTRIMSSADNIGSYQLRTSAQGVPIASGTWVAKGVALDTKQQTSDVDYTRNTGANYSRNSQDTFAGNYISDFIGNYISNFTGNYTGDFTGDFIGDFTGNYEGTYEGIYTRTSEVNYARNSTRTSEVIFTRSSAGNYLGLPGYLGAYVAHFSGTFGGFGGGNYAGNFSRISQTRYTGTSTNYYTGNFVGDYIGDFVGGNFIGEYTGTYIGTDYTRNSTNNFTRISNTDFTNISVSPQYTRNSIGGDYVGEYVGDFIGNYGANYIGNYMGETISVSEETIETYTLYVRTA